MTKIVFRRQFDKSKAEFDIQSDTRSQTKINIGDQYDESERQVNIRDVRGSGEGQKSPGRETGSSAVWIKGSFFLVLMIVTAALVATLFSVLPWYALPAVVLACVLILYLFGLILVPKSGIHEEGFLKVLSTFLRVLKGPDA